MSELLPPACAEADRYLLELAYDEPSVSDAVRVHVAECKRCTAVLADYRKLRDEAARVTDEEPSSAMDAGILAALDAHLAGEPVDRFLKLPEPEIALGAKRLLDQHITRPPLRILRPASATPAPVVTVQSESTPVREPMTRPGPARARRRWPVALSAAATIALVGGGALYLSNSENGIGPLNRPDVGGSAKLAEAPKPQSGFDQVAPMPRDEQAAQLGKGSAATIEVLRGKVSQEKAAEPTPSYRPAREAPAKESAHASKKSALHSFAGDLLESNQGASAPSALGGFGGGRAAGPEGNAMERANAPSAQPDADKRAPPVAAAAPAPVFAPPPPPAKAFDQTDDKSALKRKAPVSAEAKPAMQAKAEADEESVSIARMEPAWFEPLHQARAKASSSPAGALAAWVRVLAASDLPRDVQQEALLGKLHALMALGRLDEAQAAADDLARRFPSQASAQAEVQRARAKQAAPAAATAAPAAAPAEAAPAQH